MQPTEISVLLVDDHSLVRRRFRRMLEDEPGIRVPGEASDGFEAVETAIQLRPDAKVLMLSMHAEPDYMRTCLDAGA